MQNIMFSIDLATSFNDVQANNIHVLTTNFTFHKGPIPDLCMTVKARILSRTSCSIDHLELHCI